MDISKRLQDPDRRARYEEAKRVEKIMLSTPVAQRYTSFEALAHGVNDLRFPGYGWSSIGSSRGPDGLHLPLECFEVPQRQKDLCLLYREHPDGSYTLEDRFVTTGLITEVVRTGDAFLYRDATGKSVAVKALRGLFAEESEVIPPRRPSR